MTMQTCNCGDITVGSKVKFITGKRKEDPLFYPRRGTRGIVKEIADNGDLFVQWRKGSTSGSDKWWCASTDVEAVNG